MKNSVVKLGQTGLMISLAVIVSACNPEEYFPLETLTEGADAYCSMAQDLNSCQRLADYCQPAYEEAEDEYGEPVFSTCVANPDAWLPESPISGGGSEGGSEGGSTGGSEGGIDGGSTGGSEGGTDGGSNEIVLPPTIEEAAKNKCENLDAQYMWVQKEIKKNKVVKETKKVKVCHVTGNNSSHTIVIACPALNAHKKHDDYLGACEQ